MTVSAFKKLKTYFYLLILAFTNYHHLKNVIYDLLKTLCKIKNDFKCFYTTIY